MKKLKELKIKKEETVVNKKDYEHITFDKIDSSQGSNIIAKGVEYHRALGADISAINTHRYNEIIGLTGEKIAVEEILTHLNIQDA